MKDVNGVEIKHGAHIKYSYNEIRIPVFTGTAVMMEDGIHIEHSNKVKIKLDDSIKYIEIIRFNS